MNITKNKFRSSMSDGHLQNTLHVATSYMEVDIVH
jgi:hypothetical protein